MTRDKQLIKAALDMPKVGANEPERPVKPCPDCGAQPARVWRPGGAFQMRTECACGRVTNWVMCGHDAVADSDDDTPQPAPDAVPVPREALVGVIDTALIRWLKAAHDDRRSEPEAIADVLLTTFNITHKEPNAMTKHENTCEECGLPISICNAKAMFELAVSRNGREAVIAAILGAKTEQPTPEAVTRLVEATIYARNRLEMIADESWHGDGRDLKRSITGVFREFDEAVAACKEV